MMSLSDGNRNASPPSVWVDNTAVPYPAGAYAAAPPYAAVNGAAGGGGRSSLKGLLKGLLRHWFLASLLGLLCAGGAGVLAWQLMPAPSYTARALLRVRSSTPRVMSDKADMAANQNEFRNFQKTQQSLVKSPTVLLQALTNDKIGKLSLVRAQTDPVSWLEQELRVGFEGEIMTISLSGSKPGELQAIVNAVTDSYLYGIVGGEKKSRLDDQAKLAVLSQTYQELLKEKRSALRKLTEDAGTGNRDTIALKHQLTLEQQNEARSNLRQAQVELKKAQTEYQVLQGRPSGHGNVDPAVVAAAVDAQLAADATVAQLRREIQQQQDAINSVGEVARRAANDPYVRKSRATLEAKQKALASYLAQARPQIEQRVLAGMVGDADRAQKLAAAAERIQYYELLEQVLQQDVASLSGEATDINKSSTELDAVQDEIAKLEEAAKKLGDRLETMRMENDAPSRIELLDQARLPRLPDIRRRLMVTAGASMGTLALVLLSISWLEYRLRRVDSVEDVSHELGLRLVGALPATPSRARFSLPGQAANQEVYWRSRLNESVNAIRALLLRQSQAERLQVIMVTSASVGEGKTSLACHLATSLARAGRRTLLLDCDLRSPTAHRVFDLPLEPGLSEVLRGEVPLEEVSHPIALGELRMITAGRCDVEALHALGLEPMRDVLERLRPHYDFIVVDTPPVLPVSDPLLIGQNVDAALFSILRDVSRVPKVHAACERLSSLGVRILGAVVAGTRLEKYGADYYYSAPLAGSAAKEGA